MNTIKQSESLSDYWHHHINSWQQTDLNQISYCRQHDLNYHRFTYWRRKLITTDSVIQKKIQRSGFVSVKTTSQFVSSTLTATLPNGVMLQGIGTDNLSVVKQLLGLKL